MAKYGSDKIKGHGIPEAMEAVLTSRSRIEAKVAILKPLSAAIAIGTGGPFGAEGPIIQTGGAMGSLVGQFLSTTADERKVLLACGAGAGMAATFNTPIAGVILAIELLLFEFRSRSFIPLVIACTLATSVRAILLGQHSMFTMGNVDFDVLHGLPFYLLLGVLSGIAAIGFTKLLYWVEDLFEHLPIDDLWHPAIGALGLGIIGFFVPRVLGVGYDTISDILNNNLALKLLLIVAIFKALAMVISLGSGTSGGLLAPMFMSSAALGGAFAMVMNMIFPSLHLSPGAYALVAMAAVFGSASRATFAFIVFAFEITRDYNAILPLMLACVIADMIALRYLPNSIMTEKLARRGLNVPDQFEVSAMKISRVAQVMRTGRSTDSRSHDRGRAGRKNGTRRAWLQFDSRTADCFGGWKISGNCHSRRLAACAGTGPKGSSSVLDAGSNTLIVAYPDELVHDAMLAMVKHNIGRLPVVSREDPQKLLGYFNRSSLLAAWSRQAQEETVRETGWLHVWRKPRKI